MIRRRTFLLGTVALGLGACGGDDKDDAGPPTISYGTETCDRCRMVIGEERHAAALKAEDGDWLLFDDTGEMIATAQESAAQERAAWVHDFEQLSWIDAKVAVYVLLPDGKTPMGTGIIAYADAVRADARVTEGGGWKKSWTEMLSDWSMG